MSLKCRKQSIVISKVMILRAFMKIVNKLKTYKLVLNIKPMSKGSLTLKNSNHYYKISLTQSKMNKNSKLRTIKETIWFKCKFNCIRDKIKILCSSWLDLKKERKIKTTSVFPTCSFISGRLEKENHQKRFGKLKWTTRVLKVGSFILRL